MGVGVGQELRTGDAGSGGGEEGSSLRWGRLACLRSRVPKFRI